MATAPSLGPEALRLTQDLDRFLGGRSEAPTASRPGPLPPGLRPHLAEQVHVEPEALAAIAAPLDHGRILVCAVEREALASLPTGTLRLTPTSIPECLGEPRPDPSALDLLVGEHLPAPCRARSRARALLAASGVCAVALLAALGLARRAAAWDRAARQAEAQAAQLAAWIDPAVSLDDLAFLADDAAQQQRAIAALGTPEPVAPLLADLIARWPTTSPPATLTVEPGTILTTTIITGEPGEFLAALTPPRGFRLEEPRLATLPGGTQITITMVRLADAGGPP